MLRFTASSMIDMHEHSRARPASFNAGAVEPRSPTLPAALKGGSPSHALVKKLCSHVSLCDEEVAALESVVPKARPKSAGEIIFHEGSRADHLCVILEGLAFRYKLLGDGGRQILGYFLPGDFCDVQLALIDRLDFSLALLTDCKVAMIPVARLLELTDAYPRIARALSLGALLDRAILRQWLLNVGQRDAPRRLAHFFCEMYWRADRVGGVERDGSIALPINQYALADTVGLTPAHLNRTLQRLRNDKLISLRHRRLTILDHPRLSRHAEFDGDYMRALHSVG